MLSRIVQMVAEAQRTRAPIQRLADVVASYFVPAVVLCAVLTFVVWSLSGMWVDYEQGSPFIYALVNAVAVLLIACPCALGLATPMSVMVGVGRGAQAGVLIRDAESLEVLERVDTVVVDKTGTLTQGRPALQTVRAAEGWQENDVLQLAASLERGSEHPLATSIVEGAEQREIKLTSSQNFNSVTGKGVTGEVEGRAVALGNQALMNDQNVEVAALADDAEAHRGEGETVMFVAVDRQLAGFLTVADPIKDTTPEAVRALHENNVAIVMLTGDNRTTAEAVARQLGIDRVEADVLPDQKAEVIKRLQGEGKRVAMAGDGINDAPALAQADVGIAMGTGTDIAIESAGITLMRGDMRGIAKARRLSQRTDAQHSPESLFRVRLQQPGRAHCRGRVVSVVRLAAVTDHRGRSHDIQLRLGDRQCPAPATGQALKAHAINSASGDQHNDSAHIALRDLTSRNHRVCRRIACPCSDEAHVSQQYTLPSCS